MLWGVWMEGGESPGYPLMRALTPMPFSPLPDLLQILIHCLLIKRLRVKGPTYPIQIRLILRVSFVPYRF